MMGTEAHREKLLKQEHHGVTWLDVQRPDSTLFTQLQKEYGLHPLHLSESLQKVQHTQVEREENYLFVVLHFPIFQSHTDKIWVGQVGVFLGKDFLITVHNHASPVIDDMLSSSEQAQVQTDTYFEKGAAYLLYRFISKLLENISGITELVEGELDGIEGVVFNNNFSDAESIGKVRQKIIRLRRLIGPKRIVLQDLAEQIVPFAGPETAKYYSNNLKMVDKLWEVIEEARETIEVYKDVDFTTSTEHTNRILTILTLVFTFSIPVTVMAGLYGMNVVIPGGIQAGSWHFLGQYTTFVFVIVVSAVPALAMYLFFRKKRWL